MKPAREQPWSLGRKAMVGSLLVAHLWGTLLIISVLRGNNASVIGDMFSSVGFMIFSTLGVLVGGKAWKDFAPYLGSDGKRTEEVSYVSTTSVPADAARPDESI